MPPTLGDPGLWVLTQTRVELWLLILMRVTGLLSTLPGLGNQRLPVVVRAAMAMLMATLLAPLVKAPAGGLQGLGDLVGCMVTEFAAGLLMGLLVSWILDAVSFGGQLMDYQMGFSFVQILDPSTSQQASISGTILLQLTLLFVFVSGLHHQMILALTESYRVLPLGAPLPLRPDELVRTCGLLLVRGLQLATPVLLVLFLVDVLEGVSARFMPQLQLMQLSFPLKIGVGLVVLGLVLRQFTAWLQPLLEAAPRDALKLLG